jgi:hypothetical protein
MTERSTVARWLEEERLRPETLALPELEFAFRLDGALVTRSPGEDRILLSGAVELADDAAASLAGSPRRAEILEDLVALLHARSVSFSLDPRPEELRRVSMARAIYDDGCTKDRFMTVLGELRSTTALVRITLSRQLRAPL